MISEEKLPKRCRDYSLDKFEVVDDSPIRESVTIFLVTIRDKGLKRKEFCTIETKRNQRNVPGGYGRCL
jgi:hypothetical protein